MKKTTILSLLALAMVSLHLGSGCTNYSLGTTLPDHLRTIHVANFLNQTIEPGIEIKTTSATRREFQRDGQLRVVDTSKDGDISLTVTLLSYDVESLLYDKNSPNTPRRYRARINCHIVAVESATGKEIVSTNVTGETTFPAMGDTHTARRNALNDVAKEIAKEIVSAVTSAW